MKIHQLMRAVALLSLAVSSASAEQVYVRNHPFKGTVVRMQGTVWVELKPFADAIGANLVDNGKGGFALSLHTLAPDAAQNVPPNQVIVAETSVILQATNGVVQAPLESLAKLLNARVIVNQQMGTIDVSMPTSVKPGFVAANLSSPTRHSGNGRIVHIHGKVGVTGCNRVGLFPDGSSGTPYKIGIVDARGNYEMDIDLDHDLHPMGGGMAMTDMRFYRDGAFSQCHGRCNFIVSSSQKHQLELQVYQGATYPIKNHDLEYSEKD